MSSEKALEKVRNALLEVLGDWISEDVESRKRIVNESTFTGENDPGEWSRSAAVIIHCERGIPHPLSYPESKALWDKWEKVKEKLPGYFCEHINGAVIGVYED